MKIFLNITAWGIFIGYWYLMINIIIRIIIIRRSVSSSMAWLLVIYNLPVFGIICYVLCGEFNLDKKRFNYNKTCWKFIIKYIKNLNENQKILNIKNSEVAYTLFQLCEYRQGFKGFKTNNIQLFKNTDSILYTLIHDISIAKNNIDMMFYIWKEGGLVSHVKEALIAASKRGVSCRLILDSAGSISFFRSPYIKLFRDAGIHVVAALQVNILKILSRRMDLRQHRKIILIDSHIAYTGSMNMVDPKFKIKSRIGQWMDIMVRMEGPIVIILEVIFSIDWEIETGTLIFPYMNNNISKIIPFHKFSENHVQIILSGPGFPEGLIQQALLTSIYSARKEVVITTPYLVPSDELLFALCTAAQRGVQVRIILPKNNDSFFVKWASQSFFSELLNAGVVIYQFKDGLLHTKSILIDKQLSLLGTVNLDIRSLWLNFEITVVIDDNFLGDCLSQIQEDYITRSIIIENKNWTHRPLWHRFLEKICYFLSPLL